MITISKNNSKLDMFWNETFIGYAYIEDSGHFVFHPKGNDGCWAAYSLRAIADKLDELNKEWDEKINEYFKRNPENK